ncbi:mucin-3A-like [Protopterus annectens]|uniref:mucin-3A-like n=1 Tax=Protopterus annectens TaxID=7888 RepID=UPI001CFC3B77|nr:mucin-3A-like [Protopterus annectens]
MTGIGSTNVLAPTSVTEHVMDISASATSQTTLKSDLMSTPSSSSFMSPLTATSHFTVSSSPAMTESNTTINVTTLLTAIQTGTIPRNYITTTVISTITNSTILSETLQTTLTASTPIVFSTNLVTVPDSSTANSINKNSTAFQATMTANLHATQNETVAYTKGDLQSISSYETKATPNTYSLPLMTVTEAVSTSDVTMLISSYSTNITGLLNTTLIHTSAVTETTLTTTAHANINLLSMSPVSDISATSSEGQKLLSLITSKDTLLQTETTMKPDINSSRSDNSLVTSTNVPLTTTAITATSSFKETVTLHSTSVIITTATTIGGEFLSGVTSLQTLLETRTTMKPDINPTSSDNLPVTSTHVPLITTAVTITDITTSSFQKPISLQSTLDSETITNTTATTIGGELLSGITSFQTLLETGTTMKPDINSTSSDNSPLTSPNAPLTTTAVTITDITTSSFKETIPLHSASVSDTVTTTETTAGGEFLSGITSLQTLLQTGTTIKPDINPHSSDYSPVTSPNVSLTTMAVTIADTRSSSFIETISLHSTSVSDTITTTTATTTEREFVSGITSFQTLLETGTTMKPDINSTSSDNSPLTSPNVPLTTTAVTITDITTSSFIETISLHSTSVSDTATTTAATTIGGLFLSGITSLQTLLETGATMNPEINPTSSNNSLSTSSNAPLTTIAMTITDVKTSAFSEINPLHSTSVSDTITSTSGITGRFLQPASVTTSSVGITSLPLKPSTNTVNTAQNLDLFSTSTINSLSNSSGFENITLNGLTTLPKLLESARTLQESARTLNTTNFVGMSYFTSVKNSPSTPKIEMNMSARTEFLQTKMSPSTVSNLSYSTASATLITEPATMPSIASLTGLLQTTNANDSAKPTVFTAISEMENSVKTTSESRTTSSPVIFPVSLETIATLTPSFNPNIICTSSATELSSLATPKSSNFVKFTSVLSIPHTTTSASLSMGSAPMIISSLSATPKTGSATEFKTTISNFKTTIGITADKLSSLSPEIKTNTNNQFITSVDMNTTLSPVINSSVISTSSVTEKSASSTAQFNTSISAAKMSAALETVAQSSSLLLSLFSVINEANTSTATTSLLSGELATHPSVSSNTNFQITTSTSGSLTMGQPTSLSTSFISFTVVPSVTESFTIVTQTMSPRSEEIATVGTSLVTDSSITVASILTESAYQTKLPTATKFLTSFSTTVSEILSVTDTSFGTESDTNMTTSLGTLLTSATTVSPAMSSLSTSVSAVTHTSTATVPAPQTMLSTSLPISFSTTFTETSLVTDTAVVDLTESTLATRQGTLLTSATTVIPGMSSLSTSFISAVTDTNTDNITITRTVLPTNESFLVSAGTANTETLSVTDVISPAVTESRTAITRTLLVTNTLIPHVKELSTFPDISSTMTSTEVITAGKPSSVNVSSTVRLTDTTSTGISSSFNSSVFSYTYADRYQDSTFLTSQMATDVTDSLNAKVSSSENVTSTLVPSITEAVTTGVLTMYPRIEETETLSTTLLTVSSVTNINILSGSTAQTMFPATTNFPISFSTTASETLSVTDTSTAAVTDSNTAASLVTLLTSSATVTPNLPLRTTLSVSAVSDSNTVIMSETQTMLPTTSLPVSFSKATSEAFSVTSTSALGLTESNKTMSLSTLLTSAEIGTPSVSSLNSSFVSAGTDNSIPTQSVALTGSGATTAVTNNLGVSMSNTETLVPSVMGSTTTIDVSTTVTSAENVTSIVPWFSSSLISTVAYTDTSWTSSAPSTVDAVTSLTDILSTTRSSSLSVADTSFPPVSDSVTIHDITPTVTSAHATSTARSLDTAVSGLTPLLTSFVSLPRNANTFQDSTDLTTLGRATDFAKNLSTTIISTSSITHSIVTPLSGSSVSIETSFSEMSADTLSSSMPLLTSSVSVISESSTPSDSSWLTKIATHASSPLSVTLSGTLSVTDTSFISAGDFSTAVTLESEQMSKETSAISRAFVLTSSVTTVATPTLSTSLVTFSTPADIKDLSITAATRTSRGTLVPEITEFTTTPNQSSLLTAAISTSVLTTFLVSISTLDTATVVPTVTGESTTTNFSSLLESTKIALTSSPLHVASSALTTADTIFSVTDVHSSSSTGAITSVKFTGLPTETTITNHLTSPSIICSPAVTDISIPAMTSATTINETTVTSLETISTLSSLGIASFASLVTDRPAFSATELTTSASAVTVQGTLDIATTLRSFISADSYSTVIKTVSVEPQTTKSSNVSLRVTDVSTAKLIATSVPSMTLFHSSNGDTTLPTNLETTTFSHPSRDVTALLTNSERPRTLDHTSQNGTILVTNSEISTTLGHASHVVTTLLSNSETSATMGHTSHDVVTLLTNSEPSMTPGHTSQDVTTLLTNSEPSTTLGHTFHDVTPLTSSNPSVTLSHVSYNVTVLMTNPETTTVQNPLIITTQNTLKEATTGITPTAANVSVLDITSDILNITASMATDIKSASDMTATTQENKATASDPERATHVTSSHTFETSSSSSTSMTLFTESTSANQLQNATSIPARSASFTSLITRTITSSSLPTSLFTTMTSKPVFLSSSSALGYTSLATGITTCSPTFSYGTTFSANATTSGLIPTTPYHNFTSTATSAKQTGCPSMSPTPQKLRLFIAVKVRSFSSVVVSALSEQMKLKVKEVFPCSLPEITRITQTS